MINRMIEVRKDHDETQKQLADAIGWHRVQIAKYELGINTPGIEYLIKFCRHYRVSADYILGIPKGYEYPREIK